MPKRFLLEHNIIPKCTSLIQQTLKGLGQIMLQENAITGLIFLIGIFYGSVLMGIAAVLATVCGTVTAHVFQYNSADINKGLYGFSAALVGAAIMLFLKPLLISWGLIIVGAMLASITQHFFIKRNIPVFTLPFVLVTWIILFIARHYFPFLLSVPATAMVATDDNFWFIIKGFGQVIFQSNTLSGLLFFVAVYISAPIAALYGLSAALLSGIIAQYCFMPTQDIGMGLYSFNAVLCAIVFAEYRFKAIIWVLIAVLISLAVSIAMVKNNLIQLTFPFVFASCITLVLKKKFS